MTRRVIVCDSWCWNRYLAPETTFAENARSRFDVPFVGIMNPLLISKD